MPPKLLVVDVGKKFDSPNESIFHSIVSGLLVDQGLAVEISTAAAMVLGMVNESSWYGATMPNGGVMVVLTNPSWYVGMNSNLIPKIRYSWYRVDHAVHSVRDGAPAVVNNALKSPLPFAKTLAVPVRSVVIVAFEPDVAGRDTGPVYFETPVPGLIPVRLLPMVRFVM